jgi:hypothetical protein
LLDTMIQSGELVQDADRLRLGEFWMSKTSHGGIHSTIEGTPGVSVVDEQTGQQIATGVSFRGGSGMRVGGELLQVRRWQDRAVEVRRVGQQHLARGDWGYRTRAWIKGAGQPQAVRHYLGISENEWLIVPSGDFDYMFHFGGGRRAAMLKLLVGRPVVANEWLLRLPGTLHGKPRWATHVSTALVEIALSERIDALERELGRPGANRALPLEVRVDEVRGWLRVDEELARIRNAIWTPTEDKELEAVLLELIEGTAGL